MTLPSYAMNLSNFPEMYERFLVGPLFRPWAEVLLKAVPLKPGDRVLDVACGTGIVARLAQEQLGDQGRVVGVDVSPGMLAVAKSIEPKVEWREGNASALPVGDDEKYSVVVCQQGLQFFPDKPVAAQELRRVLAPAGRLAVATWRPLEELMLFRELHRVAERHLGPVVDQRHGYGDGAELEKLLVDAGFQQVHVETMSRKTTFPDGSAFVRLNTMALVGMSANGKTMSDEQRAEFVAAIVKDSAELLPRFADGDALVFEASTNVATARG